MADVFLSWLPFYSELKLMFLFMTAPVRKRVKPRRTHLAEQTRKCLTHSSLFSVTKILRGIPLNEMTINRGPTEGLFELICDLYSSGRASAKRVGLTSTRLQHFVKQLMGNLLKISHHKIVSFERRRTQFRRDRNKLLRC